MTRVRSNIYETTGAVGEISRTDTEIYFWLNDAQHDYVAKLPPDAFPELLERASGSFPWTVPPGFSDLIEVLVTHTVSATLSIQEPAYWLNDRDSYLALRHDSGLGAWAQFQKTGANLTIMAGPNASTGIVIYRRIPANINGTNLTFDLGEEHEDPVVNRATGFALRKINDEDSDFYINAYNSRIQVEQAKRGMGAK